MAVLERDQELAVLVDSYERAVAGRGTTVLVSGEAGVGKTSLLDELVARIGDRCSRATTATTSSATTAPPSCSPHRTRSSTASGRCCA